jgi:hypothetical protein
MEYNTALKLKEAWGGKPCTHLHFERIYYSGAFLVGYVCTTCGADFTIAQKLEIEETRKSGVSLSEARKNNI